MILVLDASAAVEVLLNTARGRRVATHLEEPDVVSPELLDVEVASATARLERSGAIDRLVADQMLIRLGRLPVERISHRSLLGQAWELRDRVRIADGFYVACAHVVAGALLTCDVRLARAPLGTVAVTLVP